MGLDFVPKKLVVHKKLTYDLWIVKSRSFFWIDIEFYNSSGVAEQNIH